MAPNRFVCVLRRLRRCTVEIDIDDVASRAGSRCSLSEHRCIPIAYAPTIAPFCGTCVGMSTPSPHNRGPPDAATLSVDVDDTAFRRIQTNIRVSAQQTSLHALDNTEGLPSRLETLCGKLRKRSMSHCNPSPPTTNTSFPISLFASR